MSRPDRAGPCRLWHRRPVVADRPGRQGSARRCSPGGPAPDRGQGRHGPARCAGRAAPLPRPARWPAQSRAGPPDERHRGPDRPPAPAHRHGTVPLRPAPRSPGRAPRDGGGCSRRRRHPAPAILRLLPLSAARRARHSQVGGAGALCRRRHGAGADTQAAGARLLPQPGHLPLPLATATGPDARRCSTIIAPGSSSSSPPRRTSPITRSSPRIRCACVSTYAMGPRQFFGRSACSARIDVRLASKHKTCSLDSNNAGGARRNAGHRPSHPRPACLRQVRHQRCHRARGHAPLELVVPALGRRRLRLPAGRAARLRRLGPVPRRPRHGGALPRQGQARPLDADGAHPADPRGRDRHHPHARLRRRQFRPPGSAPRRHSGDRPRAFRRSGHAVPPADRRSAAGVGDAHRHRGLAIGARLHGDRAACATRAPAADRQWRAARRLRAGRRGERRRRPRRVAGADRPAGDRRHRPAQRPEGLHLPRSRR